MSVRERQEVQEVPWRGELNLTQASLVGLAFWMEWAAVSMFRASGDCECPVCGRAYWQHGWTPHRAFGDGEPYLHLLCTGEVVKL